MTARYTHATDEAKRRAVDKLVATTLAPAVIGAGETPAISVNALPVSVDANGIRSEIFDNGLAPEMKTARSRLAVTD